MAAGALPASKDAGIAKLRAGGKLGSSDSPSVKTVISAETPGSNDDVVDAELAEDVEFIGGLVADDLDGSGGADDVDLVAVGANAEVVVEIGTADIDDVGLAIATAANDAEIDGDGAHVGGSEIADLDGVGAAHHIQFHGFSAFDEHR
jgi:hypothetical protein